MKSSLIAILFLHLFVVAANAQTQDQLIAGAKSKGKLVIYASAAVQQLQMYLAAFNRRYPFLKTEYFRTDKQKLVTRVLLEEQAKQRLADVVHTSVIETHILKKRGALSRYVPMESASYPSQYKDPEGFWTSVYASGTLMGFNSRQVKRAEAPRPMKTCSTRGGKTPWASTTPRSSGSRCCSSSKADPLWKSSRLRMVK